MMAGLDPPFPNLRQNLACERLAELYAPLVKGIHTPDHTLHENSMLVQRNQSAQDFGRQSIRQEYVARPIRRKDSVQAQSDRLLFVALWGLGATESQSFRLGKTMSRQDVLVLRELPERTNKGQKITGDRLRPLMEQLKECMLHIGARIAKHDRPAVML